MNRLIILIFVLSNFYISHGYSQGAIRVQRLDDLWQLVKEQNYTFKTQAIEKEKAELTYKTSLGNVFNPRMPVQLNFVDNTRLPVNLIPAEIFGGPQGVFREVVFGQQFNTLFNFQPQFDVFNMSAIGQIKSARLQQRLIDNQNLLNEYILHEKVNAIYHNIVSLKAQKIVIQKNNEIAQKILTIVNDRYDEGLIGKQEFNEAQVNTITMSDNMEQLSKMIESQENELALLLQNKISVTLPDGFDEALVSVTTEVKITKNELRKDLMDFQLSMLKQDIKNLQYQYYPTLSFVSGFNWQNLSNDFFLASNSTSFRYNNIGLRLAWDLPTVTRLSTAKNKQYQRQFQSMFFCGIFKLNRSIRFFIQPYKLL